MEVTNKMVHAAVKQAVSDKILPTNSDINTYTHLYESVKRMIVKALEKSGEEF